MMKNATVTTSSLSIPEEMIVYEIMKRLPVKTLCRFKAVSKRWLYIINSRPFIDSHFQHSKLNPTRLLGFYNTDRTTRHPPIFFSTNCPAQTSLYNWPDNIDYRNWYSMDYRNWFFSSISPRGLICFYDGHEHIVVKIWNPSTREHIEVNPPPRELSKKCPLFIGFDPISKKHKLLSFSDGENYVVTLGENNWRKLDGSRNLTALLQRDCCIDGIVYYLAQRDQNDYELVLVRFDVGSESFLEPIHLPGDLVRFPHAYYFTLRIYVYRGRILLLHYDYFRTHMEGFQIWVLLEKQKWSLKRLIPRPPFNYSPGNICFSFIDEEELIFYPNSEANFRLYSYDLEKGSSWRETTFPDIKKILDGSSAGYYWVRFYDYVETLESLKSFNIEQEEEKSC